MKQRRRLVELFFPVESIRRAADRLDTTRMFFVDTGIVF